MKDHLDDALQRYFDDVARHDRLGDTPVRVVIRRGQRRKARRRTTTMAGTLVLGALGSVVAVRTLGAGNDPREIQVTEEGGGGIPTPIPVPTTGAVPLVDSPLVWNEVEVASAEAVITAGTLGRDPSTGAFYAVSSAAGESSVWKPVVYQSSDGVTWDATGSPPALTNLSEIVAGTSGLYAVGTQAARADTGWEAVLSASADGGDTWQPQAIPIDLDTARQLPYVRAVDVRSTVAAVDDTVVVAAAQRASVDIEQVAPAGVEPETLSQSPGTGGLVEYDVQRVPCDEVAAERIRPTADGANASAECVVGQSPARVFTWDELGVPSETGRAVLGSVHLFVATGRTKLVEVPAPELPDGWSVDSTNVQAVGDGFLLTVGLSRNVEPLAFEGAYEAQTLAFTSPDGTTWTPVDEVPLQWVDRAARLQNGSLAMVGTAAGEPAVAVQASDGSWHTTPVSALLPDGAAADEIGMSYQNPAITDRGIAAVVQIGTQMPSPSSATEVSDASSKDTAPPTTIGMSTGPVPTYVLAFSRDGVNWSIESLDGFTRGESISGGATFAGDQVIVAVGGPSSTNQGDDPPPRRLLVGTLA